MKHGYESNTEFKLSADGDQSVVRGEAERVSNDKSEATPVTDIKALITNLSLEMHETRLGENGRDHSNPTIAAGYTYLGQLVAHDMAFHDPGDTAFDGAGRSRALPRTPRLDLDCIYGGGPVSSPWLYEGGSPADRFPPYLKIGFTTLKRGTEDVELSDRREDVNRQRCPLKLPQGHGRFYRYEPLIADPRNDDNLIISQLTVLFCKLHNIFVRQLAAGSYDNRSAFKLARYMTSQIFRTIILEDYLSKMSNADIYDHFHAAFQKEDGKTTDGAHLNGGDRDLNVPDEFWIAVLRIGHVMIQDVYHYNDFHNGDRSSSVRILELMRQLDPALRNTPINETWVIDWDRFFFEDEDIDAGRRIDNGRLVNFSHKMDLSAASDLLGSRFVTMDRRRSLIYRDLARSYEHELSPAQDLIARYGAKLSKIRKKAGKKADLGFLSNQEIFDHLKKKFILEKSQSEITEEEIRHLSERTPLLIYILCEAECSPNDGKNLGALGSIIMNEVIFNAYARSERGQTEEIEIKKLKRTLDDWCKIQFKCKIPVKMSELAAFINNNQNK